jgi:signal peptidase II
MQPKTTTKTSLRIALLTILTVLAIDQTLKIWVKTSMYLNESIPAAGDWFYIHFIENPGMAFGLEFGGSMGKLLLSLFRIFAVIGLGWYIVKLSKGNSTKGLIISFSLILAGALGNIIDSAFYGLFFSESYQHTPVVAKFLPSEGGYAGFLHGYVVDMLYFPIINGQFPDWLPIWGGESYQFFRPVFNIADASITTGVLLIILNQNSFFGKKEPDQAINQEEIFTTENVDRANISTAKEQ